ncbi:MAG: cation:proton antiporter family protein [Pseudomonadota bacterium]|nr:cation:proton antiporter family protein [Pseudomonadota bacterium]
MLDVVWISLAFALGLLARQVSLPPLVGYLVAGFVLHGFGVEADEVITQFSEMGVTLLLFSIGLKLKLRSLAQPQVWGVASIHMAGVIAFLLPLFLALGAVGTPFLQGLDMPTAALLAFALSFSSTVFAVKVLEEKGETGSIYGTIAIGILIMQDLVAVIYLAFSAGKVPTIWALLLLLLIPGRRLLLQILERAGHGELLVLFGLTLGLGGAEFFDLVSVKGDLGALILGVLIASHPKAAELAKALLNFKDLFLVGFFLSIGLSGAPTLEMVLVALLLLAAVPAKGWFFYRLLLLFNLRARTAFLGSLSLSNYSEFGLIVAAIGAANGWLAPEWLTIIAIALSLSFVAASPLNSYSHDLYERLSQRLCRRQRLQRVLYEAEIDPGDADVIILGMGRVGSGAYDTLKLQKGRKPVGIDADPDMVATHRDAGRNVIQGSATDPDFWHRLQLENGSIRLVLLALPQLSENIFAAEHLMKEGFDGLIGAVAKFPDDEPVLEKAGVHMVFDLYAEAGAGFAQHVCAQVPKSA